MGSTRNRRPEKANFHYAKASLVVLLVAGGLYYQERSSGSEDDAEETSEADEPVEVIVDD